MSTSQRPVHSGRCPLEADRVEPIGDSLFNGRIHIGPTACPRSWAVNLDLSLSHGGAVQSFDEPLAWINPLYRLEKTEPRRHSLLEVAGDIPVYSGDAYSGITASAAKPSANQFMQMVQPGRPR